LHLSSESLAHTAAARNSHDAELIDGLRAGDEGAYEQLVQEYSGRMLAVARRLLPNEEDCADAVQDAFVSAFQAIHTFRETSRISTWLHRILVNVCLMKRRSQARRCTVSMDAVWPVVEELGEVRQKVPTGGFSVARQLDQDETRQRIRACIDRLPDEYRQVVVLRDIEELDTRQTARRLGVSTAAVKTRLHRARQVLRGLLVPLLDGEEALSATRAMYAL
jgi:RNA polymerase sigma-70 factor (ECF subfamily)